jgi:hypothetical protein
VGSDDPVGADGAPRHAAASQVLQLLGSGAGLDLIGVAESDTVDFKMTIDLADPAGKRDLAADLAAFANNRGGVLVIGVRTARHTTTNSEVADQIVGIERDRVSPEAVAAIARDFCHPPIHVVLVDAFAVTNNRGVATSVVAITVEAQPESEAPVLVDRIADSSGAKVPHAIGWPKRSGDGTAWVPPGRIQQLISTALSLRNWQPQTPSHASPDDLDQMLADVSSLPEWEPWPVIGIQLTPRLRGAAIEDFYGAFRAATNYWSDIRANGFGLRLGLQPLEPAGDKLCSGKSDRTRLTVSHDGVVAAVALGAPGFLGWALNKEVGPLEEINISAYPLIEFFAETIRFAYGVVAKALDPFEGWDIRVHARHLLNRTPAAFQLRAPAAIHPLDARTATTDRIDRSFTGSGDWDRDAFRYVATILGVGFGVGEGDVPFTRDERLNPEYFE